MDFRESVRVVWPGEGSGVLARAVNLSAAGILLDAPTPTPCPVGSDVLCDVPLPQGPRLLRGRVAHRREASPAKVGMGIEFVDLSDGERAELRGLVADSDEKPQRVKVRFEGTNQVVKARAHATPQGFRLATSLPFLRAGTGMDVSLAPDVDVMRAWVSAVALDRSNPDGVPRLVIDVLVHPRDPWDVATPVVETLQAVPERVWELDELDARPTPAVALAEMPVEQIEPLEIDEEVPTIVTAGPSLPEIVEGPLPSMPSGDYDATQIIPLERGTTRWGAMRAGALAGLLALATFIVIVLATRSAPRGPIAPVSISPPIINTQPRAPEPAAAPAPVVAAPAPVAPVAAAPEPAIEPSGFDVDLEGSTAGAHRYALRAPDGVGFNLPHARPSMKLGTYHPDVDGLRAVWLRPLPGGGTNARFFFKPGSPPPKVTLRDGVLRVTAASE